MIAEIPIKAGGRWVTLVLHSDALSNDELLFSLARAAGANIRGTAAEADLLRRRAILSPSESKLREMLE